jgi:hypothetical protein
MPPLQLFHLIDDPGERQNVGDANPDVVTRLTKLLEQFVEDGRSTPGPRQRNAVEVDIWKGGRDAQKAPAKPVQKKKR